MEKREFLVHLTSSEFDLHFFVGGSCRSMFSYRRETGRHFWDKTSSFLDRYSFKSVTACYFDSRTRVPLVGFIRRNLPPLQAIIAQPSPSHPSQKETITPSQRLSIGERHHCQLPEQTSGSRPSRWYVGFDPCFACSKIGCDG